MPIKTFVGRIWDEAVWDLLIKPLFQGGGKGVSTRVEEAIKRSPRHDLVYTLLMMDSQDRSNLMELFRGYLREGRENRMVRELGRILPRTPEGGLDMDRAQGLLRELNRVPEEELRMFMEFLTYDPVAQWFRQWVLGKGQEAAVQAVEVVAELAGRGVNIAVDANERLNDSILGWRSEGRWWLRRSGRRQRELQSRVDGREERLRQQREQRAREAISEIYNRFRSERSEQRGGRQ